MAVKSQEHHTAPPSGFLAQPWTGWCIAILVAFLLVSTLEDNLSIIWPMYRDVLAAVATIAAVTCMLLSVLTMVTGHPADDRNRWWYRFAAAEFGAAIVLVVLRLLVPAIQTAQEAAVHAADQRWAVHSIGAGFTIAVPETWEPAVYPDNPGVLYLVNASRGLFLMAIAFPKIDSTFQSVQDLQQKVMTTVPVSDAEIRTREERNGDRITAIETEVLGTVEGAGRLLYRFRHEDTPQAWVEIQVWGVPSQLMDARDTVDRILTSASHEG